MNNFLFILSIIIVFSVSAQCDTGMVTRNIGDGNTGWVGWTSLGSGWQPTDRNRLGNPYPDKPHYESSETGIGVFRSPNFIISGEMIRFAICGWNGLHNDSSSEFRLCKASDGSVLRSSMPPQQNDFTIVEWYTRDIKGELVYFEAADECAEPGYAWLGLPYAHEISLGGTGNDRKYIPFSVRSDMLGTWGIMTRDAVNRPMEPYLSSLASNGESATGTITTPDFVVDEPLIIIKSVSWDGRYGNSKKNKIELVDSLTKKVLLSEPPPLSDVPVENSFNVSDLIGRRVFLRFIEANSDSTFAWMGVYSIDAGKNFNIRLDGIASLNGWKSDESRAFMTEQFGIPFKTNMKTIITSEIKLGIEADRLYLLGMNVPDDLWFWIGDSLGDVCIKYKDGKIERYPLIVGESLWWGNRFFTYKEPFTNFKNARDVFVSSLNLYPQKPVRNGMYVAVINTKGKGIVDGIYVNSDPISHHTGKIYAITAEVSGKFAADGLKTVSGGRISGDFKRFMDKHALRLSGANVSDANERINVLKNIMYTTPENFPTDFSVSKPSDYSGPEIIFEGDLFAKLVSNIYNHNVYDMTHKVTEDGIYHTSTKDAAWYGYNGFGCFTLDTGRETRNYAGFYFDEAWTRDLGRTLMELVAHGYLDKAKSCADWCLKMARIWEEGDSPDLLINGRRLPRHIHRILQMPGTAEGMGCFENDGHGLTSMFIFNLWKKLPDKDSWLRSRWRDIRALGDWVVWQLENKDISRATDVLWSDSEGSGWNITTGYSIYCDLPQIESLYGLAVMAESIGQKSTAEKWKSIADGLKIAAEKEYIEKDPKYGMTWTTKYAGFGLSSTLGPLILPVDTRGFKTGSNYPEWYDYNAASYQRIKDSFRLNAMGYGEGFIIQSALLLDKMEDAEELIKLTAKAIYNKTHQPYIVPENVMSNADNTQFCRLGDLGNGVQQAEIIKAIRLMAGIDDSTPSRLRIMPRIPKAWNKVIVKKMPVLIDKNGKWENSSVDYKFNIKPRNAEMSLVSADILPEMSIRLGPFDSLGVGNNGDLEVDIMINGIKSSGRIDKSGDSYWIWMDVPAGCKKIIVSVDL